MSLLGKAIGAIADKGPREGVKFVWERAKTYVVDGNREIILLRVDLTNPKNRLRSRDEKAGFRLHDLTPELVPRIEEVLRATEPARVPNLTDRLAQGMSGLVGELDGEIIGYVFYRAGSDDPSDRIHPDLDWLPLAPRSNDVYTFDYFIPERHRGLGNLFARAVQDRQHRDGFVASYGYVYAQNRAALWLYRTIGWKEIGRVVEHKILIKLALVEDRLFYVRQYDRAFLGRLPGRLRPKGA